MRALSRRPTTLPALTTAALLVLLALPLAASAAPRKVPFGFFGTVLPPNMSNELSVSNEALDAQMALMASSGVESVRFPVTWADTEFAPGSYNWNRSDRIVGASARHGISVLFNVINTPKWASTRPKSSNPYSFPPRDPALFASFMTQAVQRYGPTGTFWSLNPDIPRVPVRQWQIWNEQVAPWMWGPRPWQKTYVPVLKAAYRAIHNADSGAKVVAGSLVAYGDYTQWDGMRDLYKAGAKGSFDLIAVHPFTNYPTSVRRTVDNTLEIVRRVRSRMKARGQGRLPIIVTELTWPAAQGRVPKSKLLGLETTPKGQVVRMKAVYKRLAKVRRKLAITQTYWYSWATEYDSKSKQSDVTFRFAGLNRYRGGAFSPMPVLKTFTALARKYEGCAKSTDARVCG